MWWLVLILWTLVSIPWCLLLGRLIAAGSGERMGRP